MTSSNRVLRQPRLGDAPRPLRGRGRARDPEWQTELDATAAAAFEEGRAAGAAEERSVGAALAASIQEALAAAAADRRQLVEDQAGALLRAALELAEKIVGHAAYDGGGALEARLREVVAEIDDAPLELAVHPADAARLGGLTAADPRLELVVDAGLRLGEARVRGPWAEADLTREAAIAAARAALP